MPQLNTPPNLLIAPSLRFAQSQSKTVGMRGDLMDVLRDNSPRVVGVMKGALDIVVASSGDPFMIGYAAFSLVGRAIMIVWGSKANQERLAEEAAREGYDPQQETAETGTLSKVMQPRRYPVESAAGFSVIGESFGAAFGVSQFMAGGTGYTPLIIGLIAVWSYANILMGKEGKKEEPVDNKQDTLTFASSESKQVGWVGKIRQTMKDNPVFTSSIVNVGLTIAMLIGGLVEGQETWYIIAASIGIAANLTQALLVRKNEFNIEGATETPRREAEAQQIVPARRGPDAPLNPAFA